MFRHWLYKAIKAAYHDEFNLDDTIDLRVCDANTDQVSVNRRTLDTYAHFGATISYTLNNGNELIVHVHGHLHINKLGTVFIDTIDLDE